MSQRLRDVRQRLRSPQHDDFDIGSPQTPEAARQPDTGVTMSALRALFDEKLQPVTAAVGELRQEVGDLKLQVEENNEMATVNIDNLAQHLQEFKQSSDKRMTEMEATIGRGTREVDAATSSGLARQVAKLEEQFAQLSTGPDNSDSRHLNVMFSNLDDSAGGNGAIERLQSKLAALCVPVADADAINYKGDTFVGRLFARFPSGAARDLALRKFRMAKTTYNNKSVRCKPDLPIEKRFAYSVLFGLKYLLCTAWKKYEGKKVQVDLESGTVKVEGYLVVTIEVGTGDPSVQYKDGWEQWLHGDEWKEIVGGATERLKKARELAEH